MLIYYGSRSVHLKSEVCNHYVCPNCSTKGSVTLSLYRKHAHIYWIPMFPIGKLRFTECSNCGQVLEGKEIPEELKETFEAMKAEAKGPIWQFSGLVVIALLALFITYMIQRDNELEQEYLNSPQVGDVYQYKEELNFSTLKVIRVTNDSIFVVPNDYMTDKRTGISEIDVNENYKEENVYSLTREDIRKLFEDKVIYDIDRS